MKLSDLAEEPLVFDSQTTVSKLISKLEEAKKNEAIVLDGNVYKGVISADNLIKKNIQEADKIKLEGLKSVIEKIEPFADDITLEEAVNSGLVNNFKSIPVYKNNQICLLSKLSLLSFVPKDVLKGKKASDIMIFPDVISAEDSLSVAKSIARDAHSNRVALLDKNDKVIGILDSLDILSSIINKTRSKRGEISGEKISLGNVYAGSKFIQDDFLKVEDNVSLSDLISQMIKKNKDTAVVEKGGKFVGLITPRHILKLVSAQISGVFVQTTGFQDEDGFIRSVVDKEIEREIQLLAKLAHIDYMTLHLSKYNETGKRIKFSVHGKLITNIGMFFAQDFAWDLTQATRGVLEKLEKELKKKRGKIESRDRDHVRH